MNEAAKAIPPVTVGITTILGFTLSDWVLLLTIVYTGLQIFFLVRDRIRKRNRKGTENDSP